MKYEQGGARYNNPHTKKHLKEVVKADPHAVYLYSTSAVTAGWSGFGDELPEGTEFQVVGPDPYKKRDWYATVKRNKKGELTVV